MQKVKLINFKLLKVLFLSYFFTYWFCKDHQTACKQRPFGLQKMPFKPLSNALLNPYKAPIGAHLYNYLITKNLRWLLNNSFFHPSPTFTLHILSIYFDRWWMLGVEWWVLMVSIKFIVNPHITITQHSTPNIQHPTFNIQSHTSSTPNIQHPTPIISHPINFIISFFLCKFAVKIGDEW